MALQNIEANITLDLYNHDTTPVTVKAIQLDSQTRYVAAMLQNMGAQYDVDSGATVQLTVIRPDKVGVQITGTTFSYGDEGASFLGPYAELTQVALAVNGKMRGQFKITSGTQILRTEIFAISNGEALDASTDEWAGEYDGYNLDELVEKVDNAVEKVDGMEADISELERRSAALDLVDFSTILFGYLNANGGEVYPNPAGANHEIMTDFIPVTPGDDYTMFWWGTLGGGYWHRLCWYDSSKAYISNSTHSTSQTTSGWFEKITDYTAPSNAAYVRVSVRSYDDGVFSFYTGRIKSAKKPNWYDNVNAPHVTDSANVKSINHAGYSGTDGAPENTIPAFVQSKAHGFDFIECDTAMTSDGVVVCIHDNTIDRTSDGTGNVRDLTYQQLLQYDFGSWKSEEYAGTKIPKLEEVLEACKALRLHPYVEIKYNGSFTREEVKQIVDLVRSKSMLDSVTFISFSPQQLAWVRSAYKYARLGLLTNVAGDTTLNFTDWAQIRRILQILRNGVNSVFADVRKETIDPTNTYYIEGINKVYSYNFPVECWTIYDTRFWFGRVDKCVNGFTTVTYKYDDWAYDQKGIETSVDKLYNLIDSAFITDTASGAAAHFVDGADNIPIKSLDVNITPVQNGSGDPSPTNIRPISGFDSVKVTRTGKNLLQCPTSGGRTNAGITWTYNPDGSVKATGTATGNSWSYTNPTTVTLPQGTYTASVTSPFGMVIQNMTDGGYIVNGSRSQVTFTLDKRTQIGVHARVAKETTIDATTGIQIEMGSVATEFESYIGNTYNISLSSAGTVYGGKLDVLSGKLTVYPYYASYNGETLTGEWISDRDVYAVGTTPTIGAQVVNVGADGTEYQLKPHEIASLHGQNNIFADTGDTSVEYRADTKLYIEKLTQPEEDDMVADSAITSGQFFMIGNSLYRALANIASGATITVGTNAQRVSLSDALNLVNA